MMYYISLIIVVLVTITLSGHHHSCEAQQQQRHRRPYHRQTLSNEPSQRLYFPSWSGYAYPYYAQAGRNTLPVENKKVVSPSRTNKECRDKVVNGKTICVLPLSSPSRARKLPPPAIIPSIVFDEEDDFEPLVPEPTFGFRPGGGGSSRRTTQRSPTTQRTTEQTPLTKATSTRQPPSEIPNVPVPARWPPGPSSSSGKDKPQPQTHPSQPQPILFPSTSTSPVSPSPKPSSVKITFEGSNSGIMGAKPINPTTESNNNELGFIDGSFYTPFKIQSKRNASK